jgi:hypothetical protein
MRRTRLVVASELLYPEDRRANWRSKRPRAAFQLSRTYRHVSAPKQLYQTLIFQLNCRPVTPAPGSADRRTWHQTRFRDDRLLRLLV